MTRKRLVFSVAATSLAASVLLAPLSAYASFGSDILQLNSPDHLDVRILQRDLNDLGYGLTADGVFGPLTAVAVRAFQRAHHLPVNGVVVASTYHALGIALGGVDRGSVSRTSYTVENGDSLSSIAAHFGVTISALEAANGLASNALLQIGQVLAIPASAPAPQTASAPSSAGTTYTVQTGDTLSSIAAHFGIAVSALQTANGLGPKALLQIGQALTIPAAGGGTTSSTTQYTVQSGDVLSSIATRFGVTLSALEAGNGLGPASLLQVGEVLTIPAGGTPASPAVDPSSVGTSYTVQPGDTLSGIATHFGVALAALQAANAGINPALLTIGQVLTIPSGGSVASPVSTLGESMARDALEFLGVPYVWAGDSPSGFDCSGLVSYIAGMNGITLPHNSLQQLSYGTPVLRSTLAPGDLVFFNTYTYAGHVGIYIGNDNFVTAPASGQVVSIQSLNNPYWSDTYLGARRLGS